MDGDAARLRQQVRLEGRKLMEARPVKRRGLVLVNTGNGKGKTTAALGLMLRAWGHNMKVVMLQFIKRSAADYGEHRAARKIGLEIVSRGAGFMRGKDEEQHRELALEQWALAREKINSGDYDLVVLDELAYPLKYGWLSAEDVLEVLKNRPPEVHVVITGRGIPAEIIDFADTVSEINEVKHAFKNGIKAQRGIEF
ncbi:MAG: cob(I)yrinic acid a,c-diamide adenosyltransferase [Chloroflexi bacterium]|nr:cob(I)yrinic acid a,c-diamide adenosyltransferase [Chloroflexota bacterium]